MGKANLVPTPFALVAFRIITLEKAGEMFFPLEVHMLMIELQVNNHHQIFWGQLWILYKIS